MTTTVKVKGMSCGHCVNAVKEAIEKIPGVSGVTVDVAGACAVFDHDESVDLKKIESSIEDAGYEIG